MQSGNGGRCVVVMGRAVQCIINNVELPLGLVVQWLLGNVVYTIKPDDQSTFFGNKRYATLPSTHTVSNLMIGPHFW